MSNKNKNKQKQILTQELDTGQQADIIIGEGSSLFTIEDNIVSETQEGKLVEVSLSSVFTNTAVAISDNKRNGKTYFDIIKFEFNEKGQMDKPEVIHSSLNEATAMAYLINAAHQYCNPYNKKEKNNGRK